MVHPNTERFLGDWRLRCAGPRPPYRRDLDPALFGAFAPQLFLLAGGAEDGPVFRLAGALLADLHGRALAGSPFERLWARAGRAASLEAAARALRTATPLVLQAQGATAEGTTAALEITLAPVLSPSGVLDQVYGLYQPTSPLTRLGCRTLGGLTLTAVTPAIAPGPTRLRLVASGGRRVA